LWLGERTGRRWTVELQATYTAKLAVMAKPGQRLIE
jgi:hypothetical protein